MIDAQKDAMAWLEHCDLRKYPHAYTLLEMLAEPRLPKEPSIPALEAMRAEGGGHSLGWYRDIFGALYAHLARPHVDYAALDEARMDDSSDAGACPLTPAERSALEWLDKMADCVRPASDAERAVDTLRAMLNHGRGSKAAGGKPHLYDSEPHNCTPAARDELRAAISVLRGWSAEAAGRTGLQPAVRMVCNAAEATLPVQLYRIRAKGLDVVHAGPVSVSEVPE